MMNQRLSRLLTVFAFAAFSGCASCDSESGTDGVNDGGNYLNDVEGLDTSGGQDTSDVDPADPLDAQSPSDTDAQSPSDADAQAPDVIDYGCGIYQADCNDQCVSISTDPLNCGGCDISCADSEVCSSGQCVDQGDCSPGLTACQGSCVDLSWESTHCGTCGNACESGQGCVDGQCVQTIDLGDPPAHCINGGPPIEFEEEGCAGELAENTFRWGACACDGISMGGPLIIDAYDSSLGPYIPGGPGGGIGTNGDLSADESINISGTLWSRGDFGANESGSIGQRLYTGGNVNISGGGDLSVGDHARVAGNISLQTMAIDGNLYTTSSSELEGQITYQDHFVEDFGIGPACTACEVDQRINIAGLVSAHTFSNDNDLIGLSDDALSGANNTDLLHLELPCGRYYLDEIDRNGPTTIVATGNTALFISGDIHANNELTITVTPDAQLDLFVAGDVNVGNAFRLGSPNYPALLRLYVGGDGGIGTNDSVQLAGFIYAVPGRMDTNQELEIFGGLIATEITTADLVTIHYDRRIGAMSDSCPEDIPDDNPGDDPDAGFPDAGDDPDTGSDPDTGADPEPDPTCGSGGDSCDADGDCCTPLACHQNSCSLLSCQPAYATCSTNSDCCTEICAILSGSDTGTCIVN